MSFLKRLLQTAFPWRNELQSSFKIVKMSERPSRQSSTFHDPIPQPIFTFKNGTWQITPTSRTISTSFPIIKLLSWNIDFQAPASHARMKRALEYLYQLISALPTSTRFIIFLQEMTSSDLDLIQSAEWIRQSYHLTDISPQNWLSRYGTTILIDRRLHVSSAFRVRYTSNMGRDAFFIDIKDATPTTLRFCNTHLESLRAEPPLRPAQVKLASEHLKDANVDGGVIAGDFNAIQDFDQTLHTANGLGDAFLEGGGKEGSEEGWTWGMQSMYDARQRFGCSRMDKIWYCGRAKVENLEKIGTGVKVEVKDAEHLYVTDHLGLMADLTVTKNPI